MSNKLQVTEGWSDGGSGSGCPAHGAGGFSIIRLWVSAILGGFAIWSRESGTEGHRLRAVAGASGCGVWRYDVESWTFVRDYFAGPWTDVRGLMLEHASVGRAGILDTA